MHFHNMRASRGSHWGLAQREDGAFIGVEAVIDKDHASGLLAAALEFDAFLMLTDVPAVFTGWGTPAQRALGDVTPQLSTPVEFSSDWPE